MKRALITGITGQDGSYLTELLLEKGYEVHGIIRRASSFNTGRIDHLYRDPHLDGVRLFLHYGDLTDSSNLSRLIEKIHPSEIYNLGAQSHVQVSFEVPEYTAETDAIGTLRLLDAIRAASPRTTVFIQSLLPLDEVQNEEYFAGKNARIEAFNALLRDMARRRGLDYIDIRSRMVRDGKMPAEYTVDGIHLNAAGYAVWVDVLRPYLP